MAWREKRELIKAEEIYQVRGQAFHCALMWWINTVINKQSALKLIWLEGCEVREEETKDRRWSLEECMTHKVDWDRSDKAANRHLHHLISTPLSPTACREEKKPLWAQMTLIGVHWLFSTHLDCSFGQGHLRFILSTIKQWISVRASVFLFFANLDNHSFNLLHTGPACCWSQVSNSVQFGHTFNINTFWIYSEQRSVILLTGLHG